MGVSFLSVPLLGLLKMDTKSEPLILRVSLLRDNPYALFEC